MNCSFCQFKFVEEFVLNTPPAKTIGSMFKNRHQYPNCPQKIVIVVQIHNLIKLKTIPTLLVLYHSTIQNKFIIQLLYLLEFKTEF